MALVLVTIFFTLGAVAVDADRAGDFDPMLAEQVFSTMTLIVFVVAGAIVLGRARFGDEATWVALGFASLSYAAGPVALGEVGVALGVAVPHAVRAVLLALTVLLLAESIRVRVVGERRRALTGMGGGLLALGVAIAATLGGPTSAAPGLAFMVLAGAASWMGRAGGVRPLRWFAVAIFGMSLGELALSADGGNPAIWIIDAGVVRMVGMLFAMLALASDVLIAYGRRVRELETVSAAAATLELTAIEAARASAERRHEAKSALTAIEMGLRLIDSQHVDPSAVREALGTEVGMLRRIVATDDTVEPIVRFDVWDALSGVVAAQRLAGADLTISMAPGLVARGRPLATAEALQAILDNARKHAPGARIVLTGEIQEAHVELRVTDDGVGVAPEIAGSIFERAVSGGKGSGLGLYVAQRLMEDQSGRLMLDLTDDSGAAFVLTLPLGEAFDETHEPPRGVDLDEFVDAVGLGERHQRTGSRLDQPHDGSDDV